MKKKNVRKKSQAKTSGRNIDAALNQAAMDAVEAHKKAGQPLVVWQDDRTTLISPDEVCAGKNGRRKRAGEK